MVVANPRSNGSALNIPYVGVAVFSSQETRVGSSKSFQRTRMTWTPCSFEGPYGTARFRERRRLARAGPFGPAIQARSWKLEAGTAVRPPVRGSTFELPAILSCRQPH